MAQVEAQDMMQGKTYSDGKRVFKVRKPKAVGLNYTHTQVVTTSGRVITFSNTDTVFDSAADISKF